MARITGLGGLFFRADDPEALTAWYDQHFGIAFTGGMPWAQEAGHTVFSPFARDTDYFPKDRAFMVNLRTDDLDGLTAKLKAAGLEVQTDPSWDTPEIGRFARVYDPEGNPIELWEPAS